MARWPGRDSNSGTALRERAVLGEHAVDRAPTGCAAAGSSPTARHPRAQPSSAMILSTRRWCRPPSNGVSRNRRTMPSARSGGVIRAPSVRTFASLCARLSRADSRSLDRRGADAVHLVGRHRHADARCRRRGCRGRSRPTRRAGRRRRRSRDSRPTPRSSCPTSSTSRPESSRRDLMVSFRLVAGVVRSNGDAHREIVARMQESGVEDSGTVGTRRDAGIRESPNPVDVVPERATRHGKLARCSRRLP